MLNVTRYFEAGYSPVGGARFQDRAFALQWSLRPDFFDSLRGRSAEAEMTAASDVMSELSQRLPSSNNLAGQDIEP